MPQTKEAAMDTSQRTITKLHRTWRQRARPCLLTGLAALAAVVWACFPYAYYDDPYYYYSPYYYDYTYGYYDPYGYWYPYYLKVASAESDGVGKQTGAVTTQPQAGIDQVADVRASVSRCTYMDSTFVGTLLFLQRVAQDRLALINPSPACEEILRQMDLDDFFPIEEQPGGPAEGWIELQGNEEAGRVRQSVLQAHQKLARTVGGEFDLVTRLMEEEARKGQVERPGQGEAQPAQRAGR